jgi:hypothetical protein
MNLRQKIESCLKDDEFVFDPEKFPTAYIREMAAKGMHPVCWRCGTRLEFAMSRAEAKEKDISPGIRCPRSLSHCQIALNFASEAD